MFFGVRCSTYPQLETTSDHFRSLRPRTLLKVEVLPADARINVWFFWGGIPSGDFNIAMEQTAIYFFGFSHFKHLNMVIFHSYVKLPEV